MTIQTGRIAVLLLLGVVNYPESIRAVEPILETGASDHAGQLFVVSAKQVPATLHGTSGITTIEGTRSNSNNH